MGDLSIHESVATFTALLIARSCFSLEDVIYHVALPSLLAALTSGEQQHALLPCFVLFFSSPKILHIQRQKIIRKILKTLLISP